MARLMFQFSLPYCLIRCVLDHIYELHYSPNCRKPNHVMDSVWDLTQLFMELYFTSDSPIPFMLIALLYNTA